MLMDEVYRILVVNPGSTSTKIAVFDNEKNVFNEVLSHSAEKIAQYETIFDQYEFRKNVILETLNKRRINLTELSVVVARGGLLKPMKGGTYLVDKNMIRDLKIGILGQHACNLGGVIAHEIAEQLNIPSFVVDPVVVDELDGIARISGMPQLDRISIFHALNHKAVVRRAAKRIGKTYEDVNMIVAHLGGGVSVGVHKAGKVIDVNNAFNGDGPFSLEGSGDLPAGPLAELCFSGEYSLNDIKGLIRGKGGIVAYLGTNDGREVNRMIKEGNEKAEFVYRAMAYQVAKEIGACATVLKGKVDAIIITGGVAYDENLTTWIKESVEFIAEVLIYPGENEMQSLAEGVLRVLRGEEKTKQYR